MSNQLLLNDALNDSHVIVCVSFGQFVKGLKIVVMDVVKDYQTGHPNANTQVAFESSQIAIGTYDFGKKPPTDPADLRLFNVVATKNGQAAGVSITQTEARSDRNNCIILRVDTNPNELSSYVYIIPNQR